MAQSSNYYRLYIENVLQLAETIVIKSEATAQGLNRWVSDYFGKSAVNPVDPASWKYYRNIAGLYHPADTPMTVVSLDTLEEITFSTEALEVHRATRRGYAYGTREYRQLVARYPNQEMLILGILYPVDIDTAIAAPDFTILGYPTALVEANEYSLVARLQEWINAYRTRWTNSQFGVSDDLYAATSLGVLYLQLVPALLNLRLQACKTNEAHSYHVREYLASHGMLDSYLDHLTLRQALFLYRNIAYIERNSGQRNVFEWLVEHIMTERNLPIAEYVMRHDLSKQPDQIYPTLAFQRRPINPAQSNSGLDVVDLPTLLLKQDALALDNPVVRVDEQPVIQERFENSPSNVVLTKALESSMIDYSNATPYTLEETLLNHWLWLSSNGYYYQAIVSVTNPKTGERIPMMVKDAFVFMWYAFAASVGIKLDTIPKLYAKRVVRVPMPSVQQLLTVGAPRVSVDFATQARNWMPFLALMVSTEAFYETASQIYQAANNQRKLIATVEHQVTRGLAQNVVEQLYSDNICELEPAGTSYAQWFADRNIKIDDFSTEDLGVAYLSITKDATGLSLHSTNSLRNLQRAMVDLMGQLSSYSVQFLTEINSSDIRVGDSAAIRVGDTQSQLKAHGYVQAMVVEPVRSRPKLKQERGFVVGGSGPGSHRRQTIREAERLDLAVRPRLPGRPAHVVRARLPSAPIYVRSAMPAVPSQGGVIPVPGVEAIYPLSSAERGSLRDVYRDWGSVPLASNDLQGVLSTTKLPGFDWRAPSLATALATTTLPGFTWPGV